MEEDRCSICLEDILNKSYLEMCLHYFCFRCISTWTKQSVKCPICKKTNSRILCNIVDDLEYDIYNFRTNELTNAVSTPDANRIPNRGSVSRIPTLDLSFLEHMEVSENTETLVRFRPSSIVIPSMRLNVSAFLRTHEFRRMLSGIIPSHNVTVIPTTTDASMLRSYLLRPESNFMILYPNPCVLSIRHTRVRSEVPGILDLIINPVADEYEDVVLYTFTILDIFAKLRNHEYYYSPRILTEYNLSVPNPNFWSSFPLRFRPPLIQFRDLYAMSFIDRPQFNFGAPTRYAATSVSETNTSYRRRPSCELEANSVQRQVNYTTAPLRSIHPVIFESMEIPPARNTSGNNIPRRRNSTEQNNLVTLERSNRNAMSDTELPPPAPTTAPTFSAPTSSTSSSSMSSTPRSSTPLPSAPSTPTPSVHTPSTPLSFALSPSTPLVSMSSPSEPTPFALSPSTPLVSMSSPSEPTPFALSPSAPTFSVSSPSEITPSTPLPFALSPSAPTFSLSTPSAPLPFVRSLSAPTFSVFFPSKPTPSVSLPFALSPSAPTFSVSSPSAPLPYALSPSVSLPSELTPSATLHFALSPSVPTPTAPTPSAPTPSAPTPSTPMPSALSSSTPSPSAPLSFAPSPSAPQSFAPSPSVPRSFASSTSSRPQLTVSPESRPSTNRSRVNIPNKPPTVESIASHANNCWEARTLRAFKNALDKRNAPSTDTNSARSSLYRDRNDNRNKRKLSARESHRLASTSNSEKRESPVYNFNESSQRNMCFLRAIVGPCNVDNAHLYQHAIFSESFDNIEDLDNYIKYPDALNNPSNRSLLRKIIKKRRNTRNLNSSIVSNRLDDDSNSSDSDPCLVLNEGSLPSSSNSNRTGASYDDDGEEYYSNISEPETNEGRSNPFKYIINLARNFFSR